MRNEINGTSLTRQTISHDAEMSTDLWWCTEFPQYFSLVFLPFFWMALVVLWIWPHTSDPGFEPLIHTPWTVLIYRNGVSTILSIVPSKLMKLSSLFTSHYILCSALVEHFWESVEAIPWQQHEHKSQLFVLQLEKKEGGRAFCTLAFLTSGAASVLVLGGSCPCKLFSRTPVPTH